MIWVGTHLSARVVALFLTPPPHFTQDGGGHFHVYVVSSFLDRALKPPRPDRPPRMNTSESGAFLPPIQHERLHDSSKQDFGSFLFQLGLHTQQPHAPACRPPVRPRASSITNGTAGRRAWARSQSPAYVCMWAGGRTISSPGQHSQQRIEFVSTIKTQTAAHAHTHPPTHLEEGVERRARHGLPARLRQAQCLGVDPVRDEDAAVPLCGGELVCVCV